MLSPTIDMVAKEHQSVKVGKINVDEDPKFAKAFGIMSIPTLVVLKDGKLYTKSIGVVSKG